MKNTAEEAESLSAKEWTGLLAKELNENGFCKTDYGLEEGCMVRTFTLRCVADAKGNTKMKTTHGSQSLFCGSPVLCGLSDVKKNSYCLLFSHGKFAASAKFMPEKQKKMAS